MVVQESSSFSSEWDNGFFLAEPMMADSYDLASAFNNFILNSSFGSVPTLSTTPTLTASASSSGLASSSSSSSSSSSFFTSPFTFPNSNNPFTLNTSPRFNTSPRQFQQSPFNPFNTTSTSPGFTTSPRMFQQPPFNTSPRLLQAFNVSASFPPPMFFQQEEPVLPFDQTPLTPWMELPPGPPMRVSSPPPMLQMPTPHQPQPCEGLESELDNSPPPSTSSLCSPSPSAGIVKPGQPLVTVFRKFHTNTNGPKPPRAARKPRTLPSSKTIKGDASITSDPSSPAIVIIRPKKRKEGRSISQRVLWTEELHQLFLQALEKLGVHTAMPKDILNLMNVKGLRRENISSHLQKYRLKLKEEEEGGKPSPMFNSEREEYSLPPTQDTAVETSSSGCIPLPTYIFPRCNEL